MSHSADDYLRDVSLEMQSGYTLDCVAHACVLARLLFEEGRTPWIGRLRETIAYEEHVFHAPLTPTRLTGEAARTWTTHYVCCSDGEVYDPIAGKRLPIESYAEVVFGRPLPIDEHLSSDATAQLLERGELQQSFRVGFRKAELSEAR